MTKRKMKNKKLLGVLLLVLALALGGCTLAKEELGEQQLEQDRLIGVVAALEEQAQKIDLLLTPEMNVSPSGGITLSSAKYYAVLSESEEGRQYEFPEIGGMQLYAAEIKTAAGDSYIAASGSGDEGFADVHFAIDSPRGVSLTANIYLMSEENVILNFFPVYQQANGNVYLVRGNSMGFDPSLKTSCTYKLENKFTTTDYDGATAEQTGRLSITGIGVSHTARCELSEFSAAGELLRKVSVTKLPELSESYTTAEGCEYIVADRIDINGDSERTLYEKGSENEEQYISFMFADELGIGVKRDISLTFAE